MELKNGQAGDSGFLGHDAVSSGEYEGTRLLRNVGKHSYHDTASHARRPESPVSLL